CAAWSGAIICWPLASTTLAQGPTPSPTPAAEVERVIVTGSIIPTAEEVGPNPVYTLNRDLIERSGERTTAELLRTQPIANANGVTVINNADASAASTEAASISLRGF